MAPPTKIRLVSPKQPRRNRVNYYQSPSPPLPDPRLRIRFIGTAGFVIEGAGHTLVLDPYVSRLPLRKLAGPLVPDEPLIKEVIPHADDVLIGHSHFDHILDAPSVCLRTGARLIGSDSTKQVGIAAGLPTEQIITTEGHEVIPCGPTEVTGIPSRHGKMFGKIPLPGNITTPPSWPPKNKELRCGPVLDWYIEVAGLSIMHVDSADLIEENLKGLQVDILCLCAVGRKHYPDYAKIAISMLKPKYVIPCHWDCFNIAYRKKARKIREGIDLCACLAHIRRKFWEACEQGQNRTFNQWVLRQIRLLYQIEARLRSSNASSAQRETVRASESVMIYNRLARLLERVRASRRFLPKSLTGRAVSYALDQWHRMRVWLTNGNVEIDNNLVENKIRPTKLGAKNWLFIGSANAGDTSAIIYSIINSCVNIGIEPYHYLNDVLQRLPTMTTSEIGSILPENWSPETTCR